MAVITIKEAANECVQINPQPILFIDTEINSERKKSKKSLDVNIQARPLCNLSSQHIVFQFPFQLTSKNSGKIPVYVHIKINGEIRLL